MQSATAWEQQMHLRSSVCSNQTLGRALQTDFTLRRNAKMPCSEFKPVVVSLKQNVKVG